MHYLKTDCTQSKRWLFSEAKTENCWHSSSHNPVPFLQKWSISLLFCDLCWLLFWQFTRWLLTCNVQNGWRLVYVNVCFYAYTGQGSCRFKRFYRSSGDLFNYCIGVLPRTQEYCTSMTAPSHMVKAGNPRWKPKTSCRLRNDLRGFQHALDNILHDSICAYLELYNRRWAPLHETLVPMHPGHWQSAYRLNRFKFFCN